jgi:hypothetical protein
LSRTWKLLEGFATWRYVAVKRTKWTRCSPKGFSQKQILEFYCSIFIHILFFANHQLWYPFLWYIWVFYHQKACTSLAKWLRNKNPNIICMLLYCPNLEQIFVAGEKFVPFPSIENNTCFVCYLFPQGLKIIHTPQPFLNYPFWRLLLKTFFLEDMTLKVNRMIVGFATWTYVVVKRTKWTWCS